METHGILDLRPYERCLWTAEKFGDLKIIARPGLNAQRFQLDTTPSGHPLLPCSDFDQSPAKMHHAFEASQA